MKHNLDYISSAVVAAGALIAGLALADDKAIIPAWI